MCLFILVCSPHHSGYPFFFCSRIRSFAFRSMTSCIFILFLHIFVLSFILAFMRVHNAHNDTMQNVQLVSLSSRCFVSVLIPLTQPLASRRRQGLFFLARILFLRLVVQAALLSTEDICRHAYIFSFSFHLHGSIEQSAVCCDIRRGKHANAM